MSGGGGAGDGHLTPGAEGGSRKWPAGPVVAAAPWGRCWGFAPWPAGWVAAGLLNPASFRSVFLPSPARYGGGGLEVKRVCGAGLMGGGPALSGTAVRILLRGVERMPGGSEPQGCGAEGARVVSCGAVPNAGSLRTADRAWPNCEWRWLRAAPSPQLGCSRPLVVAQLTSAPRQRFQLQRELCVSSDSLSVRRCLLPAVPMLSQQQELHRDAPHLCPSPPP